jgi:hypothetical protein
MAIEGPALRNDVLKPLASGIARLDEDEDACPARFGDFDERRQAVVAQIGADGERIAAPRAGFAGAEIRLGIALGRAADVVALAVENDQSPTPRSRSPPSTTIPVGPSCQRAACGHRRHERRDDVDYPRQNVT